MCPAKRTLPPPSAKSQESSPSPSTCPAIQVRLSRTSSRHPDVQISILYSGTLGSYKQSCSVSRHHHPQFLSHRSQATLRHTIGAAQSSGNKRKESQGEAQRRKTLRQQQWRRQDKTESCSIRATRGSTTPLACCVEEPSGFFSAS
jgi:hypothetical protein